MGGWGSDSPSLCDFQKKITRVKINDANICILCIKETNGINADYRVFLRTVHHPVLLGEGRQAQPFCAAPALLWGSLQGVGLFRSLSPGLIQDCLQSQPVFQVFHLTRTCKNVKAISIFLCLIRTDEPSVSASAVILLCRYFVSGLGTGGSGRSGGLRPFPPSGFSAALHGLCHHGLWSVVESA